MPNRRPATHARRARSAQPPIRSPSTPFPDASATPTVDVGRRLRDLRAERGLSLRALAEQSQLNVNTISLIENGKTSPSVGTLQQIAAALDVPIVAFFETGAPKNKVAYVKAGYRSRAAFAHGALEDLGAGLTERTMEPFVVRLEPQADSGTHPIVHTGYEFVFCLEGRIAYTVEAQTYLLEPGDSLLFEANLPHRWQNVDATPSQAVLVLQPADGRDHPTARHFAPEESAGSKGPTTDHRRS